MSQQISAEPWTAWGRPNPESSGGFKRFYTHEDASQILRNLGIVEDPYPPAFADDGSVAEVLSATGTTPLESCKHLSWSESKEAPYWTIWLQSFERGQEIRGWMTENQQRACSDEESLEYAEAAADCMYEVTREIQREKVQIEYCPYGDWPTWLASSERRNRLEILHRVEGYSGSVAIGMADGRYAFAFGPRPAEHLEFVPPPYKMSSEEWTAWLNSEGRWVTIACYFLNGDDMEQAVEKADNDHEQLIGERPIPTPTLSGHALADLKVDRPLPLTEDSNRHDRFARNLRRICGPDPVVDSLFEQLYGEESLDLPVE
ncbi:hypothetical protein DL95DRAFT_407712 [Leptodontidium sp. 2 PMI_412]|nr:hypothetical protein DL95DRAFT_407712 [Leptodontidium sp. 2 PMI_412]